MDERRARIHDDLRGLLDGELLFEPLERAPYAHDASLYEVDPLGIVVPASHDDVVTVVRYAAENAIPIHARGAGTRSAGGALGAGLVVDFSRHLRRVISVLPESVVVQPGVVLDVLNSQLAPHGRRLAADPMGSDSCTIGGMIGVDAGGPRALEYGSMIDQVERLRVVFASGETAELGVETWPVIDDEPVDFKGVVVRKLGALGRRHPDLFTKKGTNARGSCVGYPIEKAACDGGIDLARLLVGSRGTLALVTEATLRTSPIPAAQAVVLLCFARIGDAAAMVPDCLALRPSSCDLFDWRSISLARDAAPAFREWIAEAAEAILIVEFEGQEPSEVAEAARRLSDRIGRRGRLVSDAVEVSRRADCERMLGLRRAIEPLLLRMKGPRRPVPFLDGLSVAPEALPDVLQALQNILKGHDVSWVLDACAGVGLLHTRPFLDLADPGDVAKLEPLASEVCEMVHAAGGTIVGESGLRFAGTRFLRRTLGERIQVLREVKDAFDPLDRLNPGKLIGDDAHLMVRDLRRLPSDVGRPDDSRPVLPLLSVLRWPERDFLENALACNSCGACRTREPTMRMCPTFRALGQEAATPRAKANLIRQVASGSVDPRLWGTEEFRENAELCVHCNLCRSECPSGVDVSSLMLEAKAAYVENHGLSSSAWALSRIELWARMASRVPSLTNAVFSSAPARWVLERVAGLSRHRKLPKLLRTPFVRRAAKLGLGKARPHATGPRVVYFVDVFANYFDHELAEAVVGVLHQAGVNVYVPASQRGSGMGALVAGDVDHARELALTNLRVLGNAVRDGYSVVCSEPTAALMLRQEYLKLTDDLDAALVAENTLEVGQYLSGLDSRGLLPRPEHALRARVGYHQPCHLRALDIGTPGLDLIRGIPELDVEFIDRGCSGMAGTFGLARENFRTSLRAGRGLLSRLRDDDIEIGATECGACRMQMEQGVPKRTLHPVKLLSMSYGLNPTLRQSLKGTGPPPETS